MVSQAAVSSASQSGTTVMTPPAKSTLFYLGISVAMTCTMFTGFWFTYFGPMFGGTYPAVSPLVHVHGWSFFVWYLLLNAQTGWIRSGHVTTHRAFGVASLVLATVMVSVGLIVSTVRIDMGLDGDPFGAFMGLPIFAIWVLFTVFYASAIFWRQRAAYHKRLILLASAAALSAATFRIITNVFGFEPWSAIAGTLAPILFVFAAMIYDYRSLHRIHHVYQWGAPAMIVLIGGAFVLAMTPRGDVVKQGIAVVGRLLRPLY